MSLPVVIEDPRAPRVQEFSDLLDKFSIFTCE
ncbi:MAG: hypothetical protein BWX86_02198 [Verrucomicrobia bacterium ADurb.Bin122]|nr:MAG: hypothetical protein BWX86_02198 [Verrucomicrobia bacterium ADurb.Bin122]